MKLSIALIDDLSLEISDRTAGGSYPTRRLANGLLLLDRGRDLAEEGVGFGVPVLNCGLTTVFPGSVTLSWRRLNSLWLVEAGFDMNLVERLTRGGRRTVDLGFLYVTKNALAGLHRRVPALRDLLTWISSSARFLFGLQTTFVETPSYGVVNMSYTIHPREGQVAITADASKLRPDVKISEVIVMNEQGGRAFEEYRDCDGMLLTADSIGTWEEVRAEQASFACVRSGATFILEQIPGARLRRGREVIGSRLSWAGFAYSFSPQRQSISYDLTVSRMK